MQCFGHVFSLFVIQYTFVCMYVCVYICVYFKPIGSYLVFPVVQVTTAARVPATMR